ncbi:Protein of unknown function [Paenibacillus sp. UNCCL117]|uniref:tail completion protein gp17 n=1 Tax=unclassified Paenibacillus TaxID=185978 RepID=UPI00088E1577|nr:MULTISPECIES: DUF3168 domain-containing protein [unclassified Paenibacillus]SDD27000.1 Protein of unknown function [Paenibacillus sp. cl123]SFW40623.1 Protein of unknown function [Paenibacillus sp. UNCCL117]
MITDVKAILHAALLGNQALVSLLGGTEIYQLVSPKSETYPRVTYFEVNNRDSFFADDTPIASDIVLQVDIWSKGSTSAIAKEVDRTMKELGYTRTSGADLYEEDTKVYHKALRYRTRIQED